MWLGISNKHLSTFVCLFVFNSGFQKSHRIVFYNYLGNGSYVIGSIDKCWWELGSVVDTVEFGFNDA